MDLILQRQIFGDRTDINVVATGRDFALRLANNILPSVPAGIRTRIGGIGNLPG